MRVRRPETSREIRSTSAGRDSAALRRVLRHGGATKATFYTPPPPPSIFCLASLRVNPYMLSAKMDVGLLPSANSFDSKGVYVLNQSFKHTHRVSFLRADSKSVSVSVEIQLVQV